MIYSYTNEVAGKFIKLIEQGKAPFQIKANALALSAPYNPVSDMHFYGFNMLYLMAEYKDDPRWCTFKQCMEKDWSVKKGAHSTVLSFIQQQEKGGGYKYYHVFNAADIAKIPALAGTNPGYNLVTESQLILRMSRIIKQLNPVIVNGSAPAYDRLTDTITMPLMNQYPHRLDYYADLLHQVAHWTGHESRLYRDAVNTNNKQDYAKEELYAHIACAMTAARTGIGTSPHNIGEYSASWKEIIQNDPKEIFKASITANVIQDYILLGHEKFRELGRPKAQQQSKQQDTGYNAPARQPAGAEIGY